MTRHRSAGSRGGAERPQRVRHSEREVHAAACSLPVPPPEEGPGCSIPPPDLTVGPRLNDANGGGLDKDSEPLLTAQDRLVELGGAEGRRCHLGEERRDLDVVVAEPDAISPTHGHGSSGRTALHQDRGDQPVPDPLRVSGPQVGQGELRRP